MTQENVQGLGPTETIFYQPLCDIVGRCYPARLGLRADSVGNVVMH